MSLESFHYIFVLLAAGPATSELHREQRKFSLWKHLYPIQREKFSKAHLAAGLRRLVTGEVGWEQEKPTFAAQRSATFSQNLPTSLLCQKITFLLFSSSLLLFEMINNGWQNWIFFLFLIFFPTFKSSFSESKNVGGEIRTIHLTWGLIQLCIKNWEYLVIACKKSYPSSNNLYPKEWEEIAFEILRHFADKYLSRESIRKDFILITIKYKLLSGYVFTPVYIHHCLHYF